MTKNTVRYGTNKITVLCLVVFEKFFPNFTYLVIHDIFNVK